MRRVVFFRSTGLVRTTADGFGSYGGQIFVSDVANIQATVPMTQVLETDGKAYRVTPEGKPDLVASGFMNPAGL